MLHVDPYSIKRLNPYGAVRPLCFIRYVPIDGSRPAYVDPLRGALLDAELADELFARRVAIESDEFETDAEGRRHSRGPIYPEMKSLEKWRALSRERELAPEEAQAYSRAIDAEMAKLKATKVKPSAAPGAGWFRKTNVLAQKVGPSYDINGCKKSEDWWRQEYAKAMADKALARAAQSEKAGAAAGTGGGRRIAGKRAPAPVQAPCAPRRTALNPAAMTQAQFAKAWREARGFTRAELADKIGFSPSQIQDYEEGGRRGKSGDAAVISEAAWLRYRLACAALQHELGDWRWKA